MACIFRATIAPLICFRIDYLGNDIMITAYNPKVSDAASGKVGKEHQRKLSCVTTDIETSVIRSEI